MGKKENPKKIDSKNNHKKGIGFKIEYIIADTEEVIKL